MKVGIAGAGILGQLLAFALSNLDWKISLFDQGRKTNCSMSAAGLLTPITELEKNDLLIFELGQAALKHYWPKILGKLKEQIFFQCNGSLVLSHQADIVELTRFIQLITNKLSDKNHYQPLMQEQISQLEPDLAKFSHGIYFPNEGQIDNQRLLNSLQKYLINKGIAWHDNTAVTEIKPGKIYTNNLVYDFDLVFDCRGLGAKTNFKDLRSIRGELIWLEAQGVNITRPIRILHPRYSLYIVPRPNQIYIVGASEIESSDLSTISVRTTLELLTAAYFVHPNFDEARIIKTVTQCRPTLIDNLPKIKYSQRLIAINGLYRHGFLIAPTLVSDIVQWLIEKTTNYPQLWEKIHDQDLF